MRKNKSTVTIRTLIIKKFIISFMLAAAMIFLLRVVVNSIQSVEFEENTYYNTAHIDLSHYKSIDINELKNNNAWIEVIDSDFNIVDRICEEDNDNDKDKDKNKIKEKHQYSKDEIHKIFSKPSHEFDIKTKKIMNNNGEEYTVIYRQKFTTEQMDQLRTISIMYDGVFLVCSLATAVVFTLMFARSVYKPIKEGYFIIQSNISKTPVDKTHVDTSGVYLSETREVLNSYNTMLDEMDKIRIEKQSALNQSNRLISNLSHDLKSPVTILKGYSDILMQGELTREDEIKYFASINESANHLGELVNLLFEQVKFQYSDYSLDLTKVDLNEFLRSTCANYYSIYEKRGFEMEIDIPEEPYYRDIDIVHMKRTFNNILENCLSHNDTPVPVCISSSIENGHYIVRFKDDGVGVSVENKERVFEPLFQVDASRNKRHSGLGLSIAKQVVERHGGTICLLSEKCYKTVFEIVL